MLPVPPEYNPHWVFFENPDGSLRLSTDETRIIPRRQDLPAAWHREGSVYVTRREVLMERHSFYGARSVGYPMDPAWSCNIDTMDDWERAETLLEKIRTSKI
jgi:CMP-N-acetylneuraminic acid synthetase